MKTPYLSACAVALALVLGGCGDSGNTGTTPSGTPAPGPATTVPAATMAEPVMTPVTSRPAMEAPVAPPMAGAPAATAPAAADAAMAQSNADTLLAQGVQYLKDNKLDLASKTVDKLEGMKSSLPAAYGPKIDQLQAALNASKMTNGKMPSGIKLPGQ